LEVLATGGSDVEASATVRIPNPETELTEKGGAEDVQENCSQA